MNIQLVKTIYILLGTISIGVISSMTRIYTVTTLAKSSLKLANFVDNKITFIGVIHHEISHALLAFISGAKIVKVNLFNFNIKGGNLGSVVYYPRGPLVIQLLQHSLAGLAPIICGSTTLALIYKYMIVGNTFKDNIFWIGIVLLMQISYHMSLSKSDIKAAIIGIPILFIVIYILNTILVIDIEILMGFYKTILGILCINIIITFILGLILK